uniref:Uncharacterized protein n=1 Tax=Glossina pallidipes TaxID=7398 RepID=A0A1A9ZKI1_GLOPL
MTASRLQAKSTNKETHKTNKQTNQPASSLASCETTSPKHFSPLQMYLDMISIASAEEIMFHSLVDRVDTLKTVLCFTTRYEASLVKVQGKRYALTLASSAMNKPVSNDAPRKYLYFVMVHTSVIAFKN